MGIYHFYEMLTVGFIFIDLKLMISIKAIVLKKSKYLWNSLWWKIISEMKILHCYENSYLWWKVNCVEKIKFRWNQLWWKIISKIKILHSDKQKSSLRWKSCIVKEIHHCDKILLWWAFIIVMNIYHYDEYSTIWWTLISIITEIFYWEIVGIKKIISKMNILLCNKDHLLAKIIHCYGNSQLW